MTELNEEQAREYYVKIKTLRDQLDGYDKQLDEIEQKSLDIQEMIQAVQQIQHIQEDDEILAPLTNGIFIPAVAKKTTTLKLNVGAGVVVDKTPKETIELLSTQHDELEKYRKTVAQNRQQVARRAADIEDEVKNMMQQDV